MKTFSRILLPAFILIFLFESCVPSKPTEDVELLPSERLINKLEANRRKIKNFEGIGVFEIESEQFNNSANFQIIMQKPDSIYFTVLGPFGIELAQALVTKDNYIKEVVELDKSFPSGIYKLEVMVGNKVENTSVVLSR